MVINHDQTVELTLDSVILHSQKLRSPLYSRIEAGKKLNDKLQQLNSVSDRLCHSAQKLYARAHIHKSSLS